MRLEGNLVADTYLVMALEERSRLVRRKQSSRRGGSVIPVEDMRSVVR